MMRRRRGRFGGTLVWAAVLLVLLVGSYVGLQTLGGSGAAVADGVQAFRQERFAAAEAAFQAAVAAEPDNVTAWLYLGRIARREARLADAADALERAAAAGPDDASVQRELGYLFMDLGQPAPAAERFDRARQLEPESTAAWIGFIRALRAAGDPEAEVWLDRAPADVKAALGGTATITSTP